MNQYPLWRYLLVAGVVAAGLLYALPNVFGEDPAVQVSHIGGQALGPGVRQQSIDAIEAKGIEIKDTDIKDGRLLMRMPDEEAQLRAADAIKRALGNNYVVALNLAPRNPDWLAAIGAEPMALGLDLRGGVHFLLEVDMKSVIKDAMDRFSLDLPRYMRDQGIRYSRVKQLDDRQIMIKFSNPESEAEGLKALREQFPELNFSETGEYGDNAYIAEVTEQEIERIKDLAMDKNLATLRNRVNELGVAEPLVQKQGQDRIVVQLPGVQDTAEAKRLLGKTATLEYRLVAHQEDAEAAARTGRIPPDTELYYERDTGRPILLKKDVIATGNQLVDASAGIDQQTGGPAVHVTLDGKAAQKMFETTQENLDKPMAVLFIENRVETSYDEQGNEIRERKTVKQVINVASIRGVFGKRFQTTGLEPQEAKDIAVLLRAGALAAPVDIVEERTVGASLGQDNIEQGRNAVIIGFLLVVLFMWIYYRSFGLIANLALILNLVLIVALLSILQATLTLPGIAGIVLTVGMAVDANVLIFERIREEIAAGNTPQASIAAGYDKAFSAIADANVTTLIAAVVLFGFGTGPIKGFAVTLSLGILTSLFTAIIGTRAVVNLTYGRRQLESLSI